MSDSLLESLVTIAIAAPAVYLAIIAVVRISGKRTLAQFNAFDFVVTVAIGSMVATAILSENVTIVEGLVGLTALVVLQFVIAWLAVRSRIVERTIKSEPSLLMVNGEYRPQAMARERVTEEEIRSAIRKHGLGDVAQVAAVVLETDGSLSVIGRDRSGDRSALSSL